MRPLPTPVLLCALGVLLPLAVCVWVPVFFPATPKGFSAFWDNRGIPVHLYTDNVKKGFHLEMLPNGTVDRTVFQSQYTALIMKVVEPGYVLFIGARSKLNLCMRPDGNLFGTGTYKQDDCAFKQIMVGNNENVYESYKHKILLSLGDAKRPYVPNAELPRFSKFQTLQNAIPLDDIYLKQESVRTMVKPRVEASWQERDRKQHHRRRESTPA